MKFHDYFSHKCPKCKSDLYTQFRGLLFESLILGKRLECKSCGYGFVWKNDISYKISRYGFLLFILIVAMFPVLSVVAGIDNIFSLIFIVVAAISGLSFFINIFFLRVK